MINQNQQFDTIRLHIPEEAITNLDYSLFSIPTSKNSLSNEEDYSGMVQHHLRDIGHGINYVKYVPDLGFYDIQISAKILRENYYQGIQETNIESVIDTLENKMGCEIDQSHFIERGEILKCDNTFNIPLENNLPDYLEALELIAVQGSKHKLEVFTDKQNKTKIDSVIVGKDTKKLQKITFYNKIVEAKAICGKIPGDISQNIENEYGMKYKDFISYFENKLRCELKVSNLEHLRKFYTNKSKGKVYLQEILRSKNNVIEYQWGQFVNKNDTKISLKAIDDMYMIKKLYTNDFRTAAYYKLLEPMIKAYDGNANKVLDEVKKLWYPNSVKIGKTVKDTIVALCAQYRTNKNRAKNGTLFVNKLGENFKELEKQIKEI